MLLAETWETVDKLLIVMLTSKVIATMILKAFYSQRGTYS
jgi:hypothetical protein